MFNPPIARIERASQVPEAILAAMPATLRPERAAGEDWLIDAYLPHVAAAAALFVMRRDDDGTVRRLLIFGDANAPHAATVVRSRATRAILSNLLDWRELARVDLVSPTPPYPFVDVGTGARDLAADGSCVTVRPLWLAGAGDPPDLLLLMPSNDLVRELDLERENHRLFQHIAEGVIVVGFSATRAEAVLATHYLELAGCAVSAIEPLPLRCRIGNDLARPAGYAWRVQSHDATQRAPRDAFERFSALHDLCSLDNGFPEDILGAARVDPHEPYVELIHGHWASLADGSLYSTSDVDAAVELGAAAAMRCANSVIPASVLQTRPDPRAPAIVRLYWVLQAIEAAGSVAPRAAESPMLVNQGAGP